MIKNIRTNSPKIILFISSYIPLYLLMIFKNFFERITIEGNFVNIKDKFSSMILFDEINDYAVIVLAIMCIISYFYLKHKVKTTKGEKLYEIISFTDETSNYYFSYISIYLLSCLGLSLNNITDVFVFGFLMLIVGYIYISNNMLYMNPTINFMDYKVYEATLSSINTNDTSIKSIIIVNKDLKIKNGDKIWATGKSGFIFMSKFKTK